jgi:hypothetical protein
MITPKLWTLYFLLGGLLLSVGTPVYLGLTHTGVASYLFKFPIFVAQALPYVVGAVVLLPWRSERPVRTARILAGVVFAGSLALYAPMLAGCFDLGGDMVGLGFFMIALFMTAAILLLSLIALGAPWLRDHIRTQDVKGDTLDERT